ncbi:MAG TPA: EF-hand domain-containing protein [Woeseiaceae bacterium]
MKKTILATLAAALIVSVAVPAMAAQGKGHERGPRIERMMERFDADRDGTVMPEEISAHRLEMFQAIDTDKSGSLSEDELKAFGEMRREMRQQNREERRAERDGMKGDMMGKHGERDGRMAGRHDGWRKGEGRHEGRRGHGPRLERLDTDKNGEISLEEFTAIDGKLFERFDRNGDNKIDITDFYRERADNN